MRIFSNKEKACEANFDGKTETFRHENGSFIVNLSFKDDTSK